MIELALLGTQARLDVAQAFAIGELGKDHAQILIPAGKVFHLVMAMIPIDAPPERMHRKVIDDLRENDLAKVHFASLLAEMARAWLTSGFRFKSMQAKNEFNSMVYQRVTEVLESNVGTLVILDVSFRCSLKVTFTCLYVLLYSNRRFRGNPRVLYDFGYCHVNALSPP